MTALLLIWYVLRANGAIVPDPVFTVTWVLFSVKAILGVIGLILKWIDRFHLPPS